MDKPEPNPRTIDDLNLLRQHCPYLPLSGNCIRIFQHFMCPISIVEADVKEYVIDEYDTVELLVLRLYDAGLREVEAISNLTGIDENMIQKLLTAEKYTYGHINPGNGEITEAGRATLDENTDINHLFQHALYNVKRELQVDSLTGTLIKAEAETLKRKMPLFNDKMKPAILPRESVEIDNELSREIRERLQLYIDKGYFSEGNTIQDIERIQTKEVRYRDAYFVQLEGFRFPFIALPYLYRDGKDLRRYIEPICIASTDYQTILRWQTDIPCLVREDSYFEYLDSLTNEFAVNNEMDSDAMNAIIEAEENEDATEEQLQELTEIEKTLEEETVEDESKQGET